MAGDPAGNCQSIHANALILGVHGLLIRGEPGSGKSALTHALMCDSGWRDPGGIGFARLVCDDRVLLRIAHGRLLASGKPDFGGLMEVRSIGIIAFPFLETVVVTHVVDLVSDPPRLPLPDARTTMILGCNLQRIIAPANDPRARFHVQAALDGAVQDDD